MKKYLFVFLTPLVYSCAEPGIEEYDAAAEFVCTCVEEKVKEDAGKEKNPEVDYELINLSLCILDVSSQVETFNDLMKDAINRRCPKWNKPYLKYQKAKIEEEKKKMI